MTPKDEKEKYDNIIGDWQYRKVVTKVALRVLLCWLCGIIFSLLSSFIVCIVLEALFDRGFDLFLLFVLIGMISTCVFTAVMLVKYIRKLKSAKDKYSKLDWIVMERRITSIEGFVIFFILGALLFFGVVIHEIIKLLK